MQHTLTIIFILIATSLASPDNLIRHRYEFPLSQRLRLGNVFSTEIRYKRSTESTLIVGGTEAKPNQFPYQVSIQIYTFLEEYHHLCGGSIYDERHIITAAHCVRGYHPSNIRVIAGDHDLNVVEGSEQIRDQLTYTFHSSYDPLIYNNDVAIIFLDTPLNFNAYVQPIAFPLSNFEAWGRALNTGWGSDGQIPASTIPKLQYVELDVIPRDDCQAMYEVAEITRGMICAGDTREGHGSCSGDSGGALVCKDENGTDYQCGIVSFGMIPCGHPKFPTVFANVANYLNWFSEYLPHQKIAG